MERLVKTRTGNAKGGGGRIVSSTCQDRLGKFSTPSASSTNRWSPRDKMLPRVVQPMEHDLGAEIGVVPYSLSSKITSYSVMDAQQTLAQRDDGRKTALPGKGLRLSLTPGIKSWLLGRRVVTVKTFPQNPTMRLNSLWLSK